MEEGLKLLFNSKNKANTKKSIGSTKQLDGTQCASNLAVLAG